MGYLASLEQQTVSIWQAINSVSIGSSDLKIGYHFVSCTIS